MGNSELLDRTWAFGLADHKTWHNHLCFILAQNKFFSTNKYGGWYEMPQRACERGFYHVLTFAISCPKNFALKLGWIPRKNLFSRNDLASFFEAHYHVQLLELFISSENFFEKPYFFAGNRIWVKKGLTASKRRGPPSWNPSQMKEPNLSFPKILYLTRGKSRKKSYGVLIDCFPKIFEFFENFIIMDHLSQLNTLNKSVNTAENNCDQFWIIKSNLGFMPLSQ